MTGFTRELALDGAINLRDLGGYHSRDGRRVRWRHLLRSGHMADLQPAAVAELARLGVAQVHDLRSHGEQSQFPNRVPPVRVFDDYYMSLGSFAQFYEFALAGALTRAHSRQLMEQGYATAVDALAQELGRFLVNVAGCGQPLIFHCMAGKDRTGLCAAVLLMALDVAPATIVDDYLLTLEYGQTDLIVGYVTDILRGQGAIDIPEAAVREYCTVHESYISHFLQQVEARYGTHHNYLTRGLGLSEAQLQGLRDSYLEDC